MEAARVIWRGTVALSHLATWCSPPGGGKTAVAQFAAGELAAAIAHLAALPEERTALGRAAYARVRETFSFEQMTGLYEDLYDRLCPVKRRDD